MAMATAMAPTTPHRYKRANAGLDPETHLSDKKRLYGLWQDDHWWCNCEPRKKAVLREVKKDAPTKGKFFWTCPIYTPSCNFFLWRDDARGRETGLPPPTPKTPMLKQQPITSFGVQVTPARRPAEEEGGPCGAPEGGDDQEAVSMGCATESNTAASTSDTAVQQGMRTPCPAARKRKRDVLQQQERDDKFSDLGSDEERQLAGMTDWSCEQSRGQANALSTPTANDTGAAATGLPTPSVARTLFPSPDFKRHKTATIEEPLSLGIPTPAKTPTTGRISHQQPPPSGNPPDTSYDATEDVMAILRGQTIEGSVLNSIQKLLDASARRTRGIAMGRERARAALKPKDDDIAKLRERVATLESEVEFLSRQITKIKAGLIGIYEDT